MGKFSWRNHSSDQTLFFNSVYDIHKNVGNVVLWGYIQKSSSLQDDEVKDVMYVNGGKQKLSNIKYLVKKAIRAAGIENRHDLVVQNWFPRKVMYLYLVVRHLFSFPCLSSDKMRLYETISWKTYFNVLLKWKGKILGEN